MPKPPRKSGESGNPSKRNQPSKRLNVSGPNPQGTPAPTTDELIDAILHGVEEGRVTPEVAENLRMHLAQHPDEKDRALMEHFKDQIPGMDDAVLKRDLEGDQE